MEAHGYWQRVPLALHQAATAVVVALAMASTLGFIFGDYYAPISSLGNVLQFLLAGALLVPLMNVLYTATTYDDDGTDKDVPAHKTVNGYLLNVLLLALAALLFTGVALVSLTSEFMGCGTRETDVQLMTFIYNETCATAAEILQNASSTEFRRRPHFYTDLSWFQGCMDDKTVLIFLIVVDGALVVADVLIIIFCAVVQSHNEMRAAREFLADEPPAEQQQLELPAKALRRRHPLLF